MKMETANKVFFRNVRRLRLPVNGNPKFEADVVLPDGSHFVAKTATDADCAYGFTAYEARMAQESRVIDGEVWYHDVERVDAYADIKYHETRGGNFIIDYIDKHRDDEKAA